MPCSDAVSGGTVGAEKGTLTLMVGGDAAVLEAARPALEAFSGLIVHVGGPGSGQIVKLCNQLLYAAQMLATAEATTMAAKAGVDLRKVHDVIMEGIDGALRKYGHPGVAALKEGAKNM